MSTINLHLPESLHQTATALAEQEKIPLEQLITLALAEKMSALMTEELLAERARRGNRDAFLRAMEKVADVPPAEADAL